jgi:hypothetical protein
MLVIIKLGYYEYTFPKEVIPFLDKIQQVEKKTVNHRVKYFVKEDDSSEVGVTIITDDQLVVAGTPEEQANYKELYEAKNKEASDVYSRLWKEQEETKKAKTQLEALTKICPESHSPKEKEAA